MKYCLGVKVNLDTTVNNIRHHTTHFRLRNTEERTSGENDFTCIYSVFTRYTCLLQIISILDDSVSVWV